MDTINPAEDISALKLSAAAAQYFGAVMIPLGAALLISAAAFIVMRFYLRAIFREAQRSALPSQAGPTVAPDTPRRSSLAVNPLDIQTELPGAPIRLPFPRSQTFQHANSAFRHAAHTYALGGCVHAATSVALLFLFGVYSLPSTRSALTMGTCYVAVFWSWSFITLAALALFFGPDIRVRGFLMLAYLGFLPAVGMILEFVGAPALPFTEVVLMPRPQAQLNLAFVSALIGQPVAPESVTFSPHVQPVLFWCLGAAPVTVPLLFFNRTIRGTVGPLFITLALIMVLSTFLIVDVVVKTPPGLWLAVHIHKLFGSATYSALMVISLTLSAVIAWFGLLLIARSYRRGHLSDQTFLLDALWLSTSVFVSVFLMRNDGQFRYLLGFLPFALYKITVGYRLKRLAARAESLVDARLLFLRVFGAPRRSERLFDLLAARWRYAGSIQLISATDVARGRFEPDEFLEFLSGRLASAYINTSADLTQRVKRLDRGTDPDGRYRVNEFFCRADTWQQTVTGLMAQSDLRRVCKFTGQI